MTEPTEIPAAATPAAGVPATGDAAVDAIVSRAAQTSLLATVDHNAIYASVVADLQGELDADPTAGLAPAFPSGTPGGTP